MYCCSQFDSVLAFENFGRVLATMSYELPKIMHRFVAGVTGKRKNSQKSDLQPFDIVKFDSELTFENIECVVCIIE